MWQGNVQKSILYLSFKNICNYHIYCSNLMFLVSFESLLPAYEYKVFKNKFWSNKKYENWASKRNHKSLQIMSFHKIISKLWNRRSKLRQITFLGSQRILMEIFISFQTVFVLCCQMLAEKSYTIFCSPALHC